MDGHGNGKYTHGTSMSKQTLLNALCLLTLKATVVACGLTVVPPQDIWFNSYNLRNVLEWRPQNGTGNRTRYTVQYAIYGEEEMNKGKVVWRTKRQCRDVVRTFCDLSNETSDLEDRYFARVRAVSTEGPSKWATTDRFDPKWQTTFGPPTVKVTVKERKLVIRLKGPMRWKVGNSTKEYSLAKYYRQMMYNVSIYNNKTKQTVSFTLPNNSMEYGLLNYSTQFCVSAKVLFLSFAFKTEASRSQCATTGKDPFMDQILLVTLGCILPSAITLFFLLLAGCFVYHYIFGNKQRSPSNLWVQHLPDTHQGFCSDIRLTVNFINMSMPKADFEDDERECRDRPGPACPPRHPEEGKPLIPRLADYAAQSSKPQFVAVSYDSDADSSACAGPTEGSDYGVVVKAQRPEAEGEGEAEGCGSGGCAPPVVGGVSPEDCAGWTAYKQQLQAAQTSACPQGEEEEEEEEGG
ncbi:hypothetical protein AAFF_G00021350 [Aldrovandia affinis]|uniref:Uncharacterized protein n=1 Tax=Aldrovandia affinis TaxID=143900 RepID=A0AAD7WGT7_9TELE|nr:hypothetical protein AAFF_G00021350 [Aldrovandia affinis]